MRPLAPTPILAVGLLAVALSACGRSDAPATAPTQNDAPVGPAPAGGDAASSALTVTLTDARGATTEPRAGFLLDRGGRTVVVTARSNFDPLPTDGAPLSLALWEQRVRSGSAALGERELALGGPACSGLDHWASDVLMLTVTAADDSLTRLTPASQVPALGSRLTVGTNEVGLAEVFADGFLTLELSDDASPPDPGSAVVDPSGAVLAVVADDGERDPRGTFDAQLLLPFLNTPPRLLGDVRGTVAPPLVSAAMSVDRSLISAGTPPLSRLVVVDLASRRPYAPLEGVDSARRFGLGAFPDEGFSFAAVGQGRTELFETASGIPLAALDAPSGAPREVATAGRWLAVTSTEELLVVDLNDLTARLQLPGDFGPLAFDGERLLVGARDQVLALDLASAATPHVVAELDRDGEGRPRPATALAAGGDALWIGAPDGLFSVPNDDARHAAVHRLATGGGSVNAILTRADEVWIATGSLVEDEEGDLVAVDCYVRVLASDEPRELARSHDHEGPLRALFEVGDEVLGVTGDGGAFAWRLPAAE